MKVYLWVLNDSYFLDHIVLWDGESTFWSEEMKPSGGYKNMNRRRKDTRFIYIGEL